MFISFLLAREKQLADTVLLTGITRLLGGHLARAEAVRQALTAAGAGAERIVITSSTAAIVYGRGKNGPKQLGPEDWSNPSPQGKLTAYTRSKTLAELRAWEMVKGQEGRLAVINPGFIIGPLPDDDAGTSGALVQRFLRRQVPFAPNLVLACVDVWDVARIHVSAITTPDAGGRRLLLVFVDATIRGFGQIITHVRPEFAAKMPKIGAPGWFIRLYALFDGDMRANVAELSYRPVLDSSRAGVLLGRAPYRLDASVGAMVESLVSRGLV